MLVTLRGYSETKTKNTETKSILLSNRYLII